MSNRALASLLAHVPVFGFGTALGLWWTLRHTLQPTFGSVWRVHWPALALFQGLEGAVRCSRAVWSPFLSSCLFLSLIQYGTWIFYFSMCSITKFSVAKRFLLWILLGLTWWWTNRRAVVLGVHNVDRVRYLVLVAQQRLKAKHLLLLLRPRWRLSWRFEWVLVKELLWNL